MRVTKVIETCMRPSMVFLHAWICYIHIWTHTCIFGAYLSVVNCLHLLKRSTYSFTADLPDHDVFCLTGRWAMNSDLSQGDSGQDCFDHNHLLHGHAWSRNRLVLPKLICNETSESKHLQLGKLATGDELQGLLSEAHFELLDVPTFAERPIAITDCYSWQCTLLTCLKNR